MKKKLLIYLLIFSCFKVALAVNTDKKLKSLYKNGKYALVCNYYESFLTLNWCEDDLIRVGNSYFFMQNYAKASDLYTMCLSFDSNKLYMKENAERLFYSLFRESEYEKIKLLYEKFKPFLVKSYKIDNLLTSTYYMSDIDSGDRSIYCKMRDSSVVDICDSYGLGLFNNQIIYYTYNSKCTYEALSSENSDKYISLTMNKLKYLNEISPKIYISNSDNNTVNIIDGLNKRLSKYFVSNYALNDNADEVVFTDFTGSKDHTCLSFMTKENGKWGEVQSFLFNDSSYDFAMPVFANAGNRLYFISNMLGGYGGWDLYYSDRFNGKWGKAINAGNNINTSGDEMYPSVDVFGNIFFASNGLPGYGGFDIFRCDADRAKLMAVNLRSPINSKDDNLSCVFYAKEDICIVLSRFIEKNIWKSVINEYSVINNDFSKVDSVEIDDFIIYKEDLDSLQCVINIAKLKHEALKNDIVESKEEISQVETNIYFSHNSYYLNIIGKELIKKIVEECENIETKVFYLSGFANSFGSEEYNLILSKRRADSVANFLLKECGIRFENIYTTAVGEYKSESCLFRKVVFEIKNKD